MTSFQIDQTVADRLPEQLRDAAEREALIRKISSMLYASLDSDTVLDTIVNELAKALAVCRCALSLLPSPLPDAIPVSHQYVTPCCRVAGNVLNEILIRGNCVAEAALAMEGPLVIDDVETDARVGAQRQRYLAARIRSTIISSIRLDGKPIGIFGVHTCTPHRWTAAEIAIVEAIAEQAALAIRQAELLREAKEAATRANLVTHIVTSMRRSLDLKEILQSAAAELGKALGANRVYFRRRVGNIVRVEAQFASKAAYAVEQEYTNPDNFIAEYLRRRRKPIVISDLDDFFLRNREEARRMTSLNALPRAKSVILCPLFINEELWGGLLIGQVDGYRNWSRNDIALIEAVAGQIEIAIAHSTLFDEARQSAATESLIRYEWEETFDALADGLLIFDENGLLSRVNEAGAAMEGRTIAEMIGRKCCTLMQGIEKETCQVMRVIETGEPVTFEIVPEKMSRPVLITISPLGGQKPAPAARTDELAAGARLDNAAAGRRARGAVCIVRDLSELRAAEASAREQRNYLLNLVEHARDAICALSPAGSMIWCNEHFVEMTRQPRHVLMGTGYQQFIPEGERSAIYHSFKKALAGESQATEMHVNSEDGEEMLLMVTFIPIYDEGQVTGVLMISRDITEEKLASERELQSEKMRMLGQIAAGVAHNFNNILAAVLGHAQLIKRSISDERVIRQADIIERAALDGAEMVKRIQSFGNQQKDAGYEPVDINQLIKDSVNLTRARWEGEAQARGIAYHLETDLKPMPVVYGSASEIREVFVNMILNSFDAMPTGGTLHISTTTARDMVLIHFSDRGVGMSEEVRKRIFEPFFTTKGAAGTGLGLAVSYSAIERHGGTIEVTSSPGRGSTFTVSLPAEEISQIINRQKESLIARNASLRILIVDDDERVREALVQMVKILGYGVEGVESGSRALARLQLDKYDLVLTDLSMPGMDGWTVATEIRRQHPKTKIIMLTGYGNAASSPATEPPLADAILSKPVRIDELSIKISQVMR